MLDDATIEGFLLRSGYIEPSLEKMRPKYPRVRRRMGELGFYDLGSDLAISHLCIIVKQMAEYRDQRVEHQLRNNFNVRPFKP